MDESGPTSGMQATLDSAPDGQRYALNWAGSLHQGVAGLHRDIAAIFPSKSVDFARFSAFSAFSAVKLFSSIKHPESSIELIFFLTFV